MFIKFWWVKTRGSNVSMALATNAPYKIPYHVDYRRLVAVTMKLAIFEPRLIEPFDNRRLVAVPMKLTMYIPFFTSVGNEHASRQVVISMQLAIFKPAPFPKSIYETC